MNFLSKMTAFFTFFLLIFSLHATSTPPQWLDNYSQALNQAKTEHKKLLILFTGSDWCHWCQKLKLEVLSQKEFLEVATPRFVLLYVDLPRDTQQLSAEQLTHNQNLAQTYNIHDYPTTIILDENEKILAQTSYQEGGVQAYFKKLDQLILVGEKIANELQQISTTQGLERAQALVQILNDLDAQQQVEHLDLMKEVLQLDLQDQLQVRQNYAIKALVAPAVEQALTEIRQTNLSLAHQLKSLRGQVEKQAEMAQIEAKMLENSQKKMEILRQDLTNFDQIYKFTQLQRQEFLTFMSVTYCYSNFWEQAIASLEQAISMAPKSKEVPQLSQRIKSIQEQFLTPE